MNLVKLGELFKVMSAQPPETALGSHWITLSFHPVAGSPTCLPVPPHRPVCSPQRSNACLVCWGRVGYGSNAAWFSLRLNACSQSAVAWGALAGRHSLSTQGRTQAPSWAEPGLVSNFVHHKAGKSEDTFTTKPSP